MEENKIRVIGFGEEPRVYEMWMEFGVVDPEPIMITPGWHGKILEKKPFTYEDKIWLKGKRIHKNTNKTHPKKKRKK